MSRVTGALTALAWGVACGTSATAADTQNASIHWSGADIAVPIPAGYCLPDGPYIDTAAKVAQIDAKNVTLLTLYDCEEMRAGGEIRHPIIVKAPRTSFGEIAKRPEFLAMFKSTPLSDLAKAMNLQKASAESSQNASKTAGKDVQIDLKFQPLGADDYGMYMAGVAESQSGDQLSKTAVGAVLTTIKDRPLLYYVFLPGGEVSDVSAALNQAKANVRVWIKVSEP